MAALFTIDRLVRAGRCDVIAADPFDVLLPEGLRQRLPRLARRSLNRRTQDSAPVDKVRAGSLPGQCSDEGLPETVRASVVDRRRYLRMA